MYTKQDLEEVGGGQLSPQHNERALAALNGFANLFGKPWVETALKAYIQTDPSIIAILKKDRIYRGICQLEMFVSLWEDFKHLSTINGFDELKRKLANGTCFDDVDFEISVGAKIARHAALVELEPIVNGGPKKSDCRFKPSNNSKWVYVEATRKRSATAQSIIDKRGNELARLASEIDPSRRCIVVVKRPVDDNEYSQITDWLKQKPAEGAFSGIAEFFTVPHDTDERTKALSYVSDPVSVRQHGSLELHSFGVAYLHVPDLGAALKLKDKTKQVPTDQEAVLFVDLSVVAGGFRDWKEQIMRDENSKNYGAVILTRNGFHSDGYKCEMELIKIENPNNPLAEATEKFLLDLVSSSAVSFSLM